MLGVLLLQANQVVSVDRLAELLWERDPPALARRIVHSHASRIRALLSEADVSAAGPAGELVTVGGGYRLTADPNAVDAHRFRALVDSTTTMTNPAKRVAQLRTALQLWRGPIMDQAATDRLRQRLGADLEERCLAATEDLMSDSLTLGQERLVLPELAQLAAAHPARERLVELYMRALHGVGRKAEALQVYDRTRTYLADELGIDPGPALRERHWAVLRADPRPRPPSVPSTPAVESPIVVPRQLPLAPQLFTGRAGELAALEQAGAAATVVISAIDGMAGVGKTALALHAAHKLAGHYPHGQLFIDLHGYTPGMAPVEPGEALDRMLRALGIPGTQIPAGLEDRAALYRSRLAEQRMLIVLDNAATEDQVAPLLPGAAGCLVLVTSRRRLVGLDQTQSLSLDTLPIPDAITLFRSTVGEARLAGQPLGLLTELVELCGRLPLAIRIAAARLRSHPSWRLSYLVARLRDQRQRLSELEAGQRSVTAALDVSYQHLNPDLQRAYRLLGLHPGVEFDGYATAAVLDSALSHARRMLDQLLDVHLLLEPEPGRYRFHDLTRDHAAHIAASDQAEPTRSTVVDRLLDYYRSTASAAVDTAYPYEREHRPQHPPASTPTPELLDPAVALGWLDTELPNLLAAAGYATERSRPAHTIHLSSLLHRHLHIRGRYDNAETLHLQALGAARLIGDPSGELDALIGLGHIRRMQGRHEQATGHLEQALQIARATGHRPGELNALTGLGQAHLRQGRYEQASSHFQQALQVARATGHRPGELNALTGLGNVNRRQGRYEHATGHFEQALTIAGATGNRPGELNALTGLGHVHSWQGKYEQATGRFQQARQIARATGHRPGELIALIGLGQVHRRQGRYEQATGHFEQALQIARAIGDRPGEMDALIGLGHVYRIHGRYEQATGHLERALRMARATGHLVSELNALTGLGLVHWRQGRHGRAAGHLRQVLSLAQERGDRNFQFEARQGLGRLYTAIGRPRTAINHHDQALARAIELGQPDDQARAHDGLAHAYRALHHHEQAHSHWQHALYLLTSHGISHTDDEDTTVPAIHAHLADLDQQDRIPTSRREPSTAPSDLQPRPRTTTD